MAWLQSAKEARKDNQNALLCHVGQSWAVGWCGSREVNKGHIMSHYYDRHKKTHDIRMESPGNYASNASIDRFSSSASRCKRRRARALGRLLQLRSRPKGLG